MRWLGLCKTGTVMDYRPVLFLEEGGGYAVVRSRSGRSAVARVERGEQCVGSLGRWPCYSIRSWDGSICRSRRLFR
ncbi:MAG: hypothetical protein ACP5HD_08755 [Thermoproteus sp.]